MNDTENKGLGSTASKGIGSFFFAAIPWVIAVGASSWLGLYMTFHEDHKELKQEDRMATYVGAAERPKVKIGIETRGHDCIVLSRAEFDGSALLMYAENRCPGDIRYLEWHADLVSPDNTIIESWYTNWQCAEPTERGEKAECRHKFDAVDDRTAKVVVWFKSSLASQ
jgi:hypothetical protein